MLPVPSALLLRRRVARSVLSARRACPRHASGTAGPCRRSVSLARARLGLFPLPGRDVCCAPRLATSRSAFSERCFTRNREPRARTTDSWLVSTAGASAGPVRDSPREGLVLLLRAARKTRHPCALRVIVLVGGLLLESLLRCLYCGYSACEGCLSGNCAGDSQSKGRRW